jgi:hypothetical protein
MALILLPVDLRAAEFIFVNLDGANEGLNDPTIVAPVGGNPGTTLGAQRLAILELAGQIWGGFLVSAVPIRVNVDFSPLGTNVLAQAGTESNQANFINAPRQNVWYPIALANSLAGIDLEPGEDDISITASSNGAFYYGLDSATPPEKSNFVDVLLHELAHGLGFISLVNAANGSLFSGQIDIFSTFILDRQFETTWPNFTSSQRVNSAVNDPNLVWNGPFTTAGLPQKLSASTSGSNLRLTASFPGLGSNFIPFESADFTPTVSPNGFSGVIAIPDPANACGTILNPSQVTGKIALVRRGGCNFDDKVFRAQQAGASAVVIANNDTTGVLVPGGDGIVNGVAVSISIPAVFISKEDGDALVAAASAVQLDFTPVPDSFAGANGRQVRLHAPQTFSGGSSVSHWTTAASPNLLMEPIINPNLDRKLDLTLTQMKDIGWKVVDIPFPHLTYDSWKTLVFTSADSMTHPSDDPDGDGVSNQEEYFFGNHPKQSDAANLPVFRFGPGQAELVFTRSKLTTDLSYVLEKSTTLDSFEPATPGVDYQLVSTQSLSTEAETITLRLLDPPENRFFLRLRIQKTP